MFPKSSTILRIFSNPFLAAQRASFGAPAKKTRAAAGKVLPVKQQLMKRKKEMIARSSQMDNADKFTAIQMLSDALFKVSTKSTKVSEAELDRRATISKAWSRLTMLRQHAQSSWEKRFLESKLKAIKELEVVSPELASAAKFIDYGIPPLHRRIATVTAPDPEKFPYTMDG